MSWLENETMRLRALEPEDLSLLYKWENDTDGWSTGNTLAPYSRYVLKEYIAESRRSIFETGQVRFMADWKDTAETVGMVDLYDFDPYHKRAGVGIMVGKAYQAKGLGIQMINLLVEYAFVFLKMHQLYVHIPINNEASRALFARCGFVVTGLLNDWIVTKEGYRDVQVMQLLHKNKRLE